MKHWYYPRLTFVTFLLLPFSVLFGVLVKLRRFCYRLKLKKSYRFHVPVIVVGNISVGGTGKTPLTIWLAQYLQSNGYKPGIVSRGIGGLKQQKPYWVDAQSDPRIVGDEALLLVKRAHCPMVICIDRPAAVKDLLHKSDCDVVISDDGLQHYALGRDIEIAVMDGNRGLGNRRLLPAGPLREKASRLNQVDFIVRQGQAKENEFAMQLQGHECISLVNEKTKHTIDDFAGRKVHAVAAIGHPERFFAQLRQCGLTLIEHVLPDHYHFQEQDICFSDDLPVLMTEKDAVKCKGLADQRHWYFPVEAKVDDELGLAILDRLRERVVQMSS